MGAAELYDDRKTAHEQGDADILHNLRAVSHHQDEERRDEEHQRELQNDERSHLAELLRRCHTAGSHLIGQRRGRKTDGTEAHSHRIRHQTDHSGEHRLEAQSDEDGSGDGHSRSEACHSFEHTAEAPRQQEHKQALVGGHLDELRLDGFNLLRLAKDVVTEDGADDDQDNGETGLEEALDDRPDGDADDADTGELLRQDAHRRNGKERQEDCNDKSDHGTFVARHFETHHQNDEQHDWDNRN